MRIKAYAKVNLSLDVTGKRPDGYHTLSSVFQSVSLYDNVSVAASDRLTVAFSDMELNNKVSLCFKAAKLFFETAQMSGGAEIYVENRIPRASGLGGGSADAAAVLVALNKLYGYPLTSEKLLDLALMLGADVPFCVLGGTRLCEGIGEKMTELPSMPQCFIVIAKKGEKSSTADMYRALDEFDDRRRPDTARILNGLRSGDLYEMFRGAYNCFEAVTDSSALAEIRTAAESFGAVYCGISGAGPSGILVFENKSNAETAERCLANSGFESFLSHPVGHGVEIID